MLGYKLTKQASLDIESILKYTNNNWDLNQAKKYGQELFTTFDSLTKSSNIGTLAVYIFKNVFKIKINRHLIIYTIKEKQIIILRVLHQSMDVDNQNITVDF